MKNWLRDNKIWVISACALVVCLAGAWSFYGLVGRRLIESMYRGESIDALHGLMKGRSSTPLENYYEAAEQFLWSITLKSTALFVILAILIKGRLIPGVLFMLSSLALSLFFLFSLFELFPTLIRPLHLDNIDYYSCKDAYIADPVLVFREKPFFSYTISNFKGILYSPVYGVEVPSTTYEYVDDETGFRKGLREESADVLLIGDSYLVYGDAEADFFGKRLERQSGLKVTTLAQAGYGPFQYLELLKRYGLREKPKYAFFSFYEGNDIEDIRDYLEWRHGGEYTRYVLCLETSFSKRYFKALKSASRYVRETARFSADAILHKISAKSVGPNLVVLNVGGKKHVSLFFFKNETTPANELLRAREWQELKRILQEFKNVCETNNITPIVMFLPIKEHIYAEYSTEQNSENWLKIRSEQVVAKGNREQALLRLAREVQLEVIDLTTIFESSARDGKILYYPFDNHWNSEGREIAAAYVAQALNQRGVLPRTNGPSQIQFDASKENAIKGNTNPVLNRH